ncbi:MAG: FAD-dependent oxidoreductase [Myxococcota bacterium]
MPGVPRRAVLQGLIAGGLVGWPTAGWARRGRLRPDPDFARLLPWEPYAVGVRPFREGGVRLERDAPLAGKALVHNYGHGGAGITLAFGCAEEAADLVEAAIREQGERPASVAVIGTGVIGMTTAAALVRRRPKLPVTVYTRELDLRETTSAVAGGQFEPSGVWRQHADDAGRARLERWLRGSRDRIRALEPEWAKYGIAERDNFTLANGSVGFDEGTPRDVVAEPTSLALPFERLRAPGRRYRTWLLDPPRLLPALRSDLERDGVRFEQRGFRTPDDVAQLDQTVLVNCTGYGAKALFGDDALVPQRGHLVKLVRPSEKHDYLFGGGCGHGVTSYVFCRHDDIVVGGTVLSGDDRPFVDDTDGPVFERLLANAAAVFAGLPEQCVPTRP